MFLVEVVIGMLVLCDGYVLVLNNGVYCQCFVKICCVFGCWFMMIDYCEDCCVDLVDVECVFVVDLLIMYVVFVYCEIGVGVLNLLYDVVQVVVKYGCVLIVDVMSLFGVIDIDVCMMLFDVVIVVFGKCLEGVLGFGFVIVKCSVFECCEGNSYLFVMDLYDQWVYMQCMMQWCFMLLMYVVVVFDVVVV